MLDATCIVRSGEVSGSGKEWALTRVAAGSPIPSDLPATHRQVSGSPACSTWVRIANAGRSIMVTSVRSSASAS